MRAFVNWLRQAWGDIPDKPTFAQVAYSGGYNDLSGKPTIPAAQINADWNASSGVAQVLNKPTIPAAQVQSDWNASTGVTAIANKPTLATVATSGSYNDLSNKPATPPAPTQSQPTRTLNTIFQISATRPAIVAYSVQITVTASIGGGQNGDVILEIASDSGFTTNVQTLAIAGNGQTYTLAIALQGVQPTTNTINGFVPAGYYVRLRTVNNIGAATYSMRAQQEALI